MALSHPSLVAVSHGSRDTPSRSAAACQPCGAGGVSIGGVGAVARMKRSSAATIAAASSGVGDDDPVFRDVAFLKGEGWVCAVMKFVRDGSYRLPAFGAL